MLERFQLVASAIAAPPAVAGPKRLAHVPVSEVTRPPTGWVEFCARQPDECTGARTAPRNLAFSAQAWKRLVRINKWVNKAIKPLTDLDHWGLIEVWSYPDDGYGDCEDYVLLKRRMLIESERGVTRDRRTRQRGRGPCGVNGDYKQG
jgi:predicted transglutaminase-like cysteine proteinase